MLAWQLAVLDDDHRQVDLTREHRSIADTEDRWRVDEDEVEAALHVCDELGHAAGVQDTSSIGWQDAGRHEVEVVDWRLQDDVLQHQIRGEIVGQTNGVVDVEEGVQLRTAQVTVDHERVVPTLRTDVGQVDQSGRLALTRTTTDDGDRVGVSALAVELDIRS